MESIDKQIAELERQLATLRRQKLTDLQTQMAALEAAMKGESTATPVRRSRKGAQTKGWANLEPAPAARTAKKRTRRKSRKISDEEAIAALTTAVTAAGEKGTSAREAAEKAGIIYQRAISLMNDNFTKSGSGKWTRYKVK